MYKDEIITEIWENRAAYFEHYHHDLCKMISNLKIREKHSGKAIIDRRPMTKKLGNAPGAAR